MALGISWATSVISVCIQILGVSFLKESYAPKLEADRARALPKYRLTLYKHGQNGNTKIARPVAMNCDSANVLSVI